MTRRFPNLEEPKKKTQNNKKKKTDPLTFTFTILDLV